MNAKYIGVHYPAYMDLTTIVNYKELWLEWNIVKDTNLHIKLGMGRGRDESRVGKWWVEMNVLRETSKFRKIYFFSPLIRSFILGHTPTLSLLITKNALMPMNTHSHAAYIVL